MLPSAFFSSWVPFVFSQCHLINLSASLQACVFIHNALPASPWSCTCERIPPVTAALHLFLQSGTVRIVPPAPRTEVPAILKSAERTALTKQLHKWREAVLWLPSLQGMKCTECKSTLNLWSSKPPCNREVTSSVFPQPYFLNSGYCLSPSFRSGDLKLIFLTWSTVKLQQECVKSLTVASISFCPSACTNYFILI